MNRQAIRILKTIPPDSFNISVALQVVLLVGVLVMICEV